MTVSYRELAAIRLGYGLSPLILPPADLAGVLASVDEATDPRGGKTLAEAQEAGLRLADYTRRLKAGETAIEDERRAYARELDSRRGIDAQERLARAVEAPAGFGERLVQFWTDHFTAVAKGSANQMLAEVFVNEAIRPNLNRHFADLFIAADLHPLMLLYLDQTASFGPNSRGGKKPKAQRGLNENLAREALELHSVGAHTDYSQKDVRQLAELLTGLTFSYRKGFAFRPGLAEPGAETVLGKTYGGDGAADIADIHAVLGDLARHPATVEHISRKLAVHFLADDPPVGAVERIKAAWLASDGHLPSVYQALADSPDLAGTLRKKVKQPFDFIASCLRAIGVGGDEVRAWDRPAVRRVLMLPLDHMGQPWRQPVGPNGWPEEAETWITAQSLAARINWGWQFPKRLLTDLPDPRDLLAAALGQTASDDLDWAVPKAESAREGVALILASSDFNRR